MTRAAHPPETIARLRLARSESVGPIAYRELLQRFGSAEAALAALPELARRAGRRAALRLTSRAEAEAELAAIEKLGGRLVALGDSDYPSALAAIDDAPPVFTLLGQAALLRRPAIAIVGARDASGNGRRFAEDLARGLSAAGLVVVSGLARGIDAAAHRGALTSGTIAVYAGGADRIYPRENEELAAAIVRQGAVIAEMSPGTEPQARFFPRRNRIVAGLARAVIVVEAAERSGSLITARLALEQGREVLAVPGSPLDPRCRGSNGLIRQGASLCETAEDVLAALGPLAPPESLEEPATAPDPAPGPAGGGTPETPLHESEAIENIRETTPTQVAELLGPSPLAVDELVRQCQFSAPAVRAALLELELAGRLERHPGDRVSLAL